MERIKKPISVILSLIMILGVFTVVPFTKAGALDTYYVDADGTVHNLGRHLRNDTISNSHFLKVLIRILKIFQNFSKKFQKLKTFLRFTALYK